MLYKHKTSFITHKITYKITYNNTKIEVMVYFKTNILIIELKTVFKKINSYIIIMKDCTRCHIYKDDQQFIRNDGHIMKLCINCHTTLQQYRENNRQLLCDKSKKYYSLNKDKRLAYQKNYSKQNKDKITMIIYCACGGKYRKDCKWRHIKSQKHQKYMVGHK
jgi:hypothetical protein